MGVHSDLWLLIWLFYILIHLSRVVYAAWWNDEWWWRWIHRTDYHSLSTVMWCVSVWITLRTFQMRSAVYRLYRRPPSTLIFRRSSSNSELCAPNNFCVSTSTSSNRESSRCAWLPACSFFSFVYTSPQHNIERLFATLELDTEYVSKFEKKRCHRCACTAIDFAAFRVLHHTRQFFFDMYKIENPSNVLLLLLLLLFAALYMTVCISYTFWAK